MGLHSIKAWRGYLKRFWACLRGYGLPLDVVQVRGGRLFLYPGTIRDEPDYDEGWFWACVQRARIVYDIGANIGQSAIVALMVPSVERVVLVDPNPMALSIAAVNLIHNAMEQRAHFVCAFCGDRDDSEASFYTIGFGAAGSIFPSHARTASQKGFVSRVRTITLDTLVQKTGWVPDFVKVDVEGAESMVLQGGVGLAREYRPRFLVEMHHQNELPMIQNAEAVLAWCERVGYRAWYLKEHTELLSPQMIAHRGRCHLLLLPAEEDYPDWLRGIEQGAPGGFRG